MSKGTRSILEKNIAVSATKFKLDFLHSGKIRRHDASHGIVYRLSIRPNVASFVLLGPKESSSWPTERVPRGVSALVLHLGPHFLELVF